MDANNNDDMCHEWVLLCIINLLLSLLHGIYISHIFSRVIILLIYMCIGAACGGAAMAWARPF